MACGPVNRTESEVLRNSSVADGRGLQPELG